MLGFTELLILCCMGLFFLGAAMTLILLCGGFHWPHHHPTAKH